MATCRKEKHFDLLYMSGTQNSSFYIVGVKSTYKPQENMLN